VDLSRHLRYFLVTADEMHFGRAADRLGIAQPPLSQAIRRLERELGVELFDRSRRQVELTAAGRILLTEARELLAREQRLRVLMRKARDGALGTLRAAVPPETPATAMNALLRRLAGTVPGLEVDLQELTTAEQLRSLASAQLDVGLVYHPVEAGDLRFGPMVEVPLGVVLPRLSPLARMPEIALCDLAGHDLVLFPRPTAPAWYDHVLETCRAGGFAPGRVRHARNPEFMLGLVMGDRGVAFEQEAIARREPRVVWRPLAGTSLRRRISSAWPAASPRPAAARFGEVAAEVLTETSPSTVPAADGDADTPRPWTVVYTPGGEGGYGTGV